MLIFGIGALALAGFLAWLLYQDFTNERPVGFLPWLGFVAVAGGALCTAVVAIAAFFR
jgi:hypothetical protein